jgi:hypothetical protein
MVCRPQTLICAASLWVLLLLGCMSCSPVQDERPDVPIVGGMSFEALGDTAQWTANLDALQAAGIRAVMISLPLRADTTAAALPQMPSVVVALPRLAQDLARRKMEMQLAISPLNLQSAFPHGTPSDPGRWFYALQAVCDTMLSAAQPTRLVVGKDLLPVESFNGEWCMTTEALRRRHPTCKFSYGCSIDRIKEVNFLTCMDELSVVWSPPGDGNPVAYCRDWNFQAGLVAAELGKPVLGYEANLLGKDQALEFSCRLQYWPKEVQVSGLVLNTLYSRTVLQDSTSYYGLANKPTFHRALSAYLGAEKGR